MGNNIFRSKPSPEESAQITQATKDFYSGVSAITTSIKTNQDKNIILPETASYLHKQTREATDWLKKNRKTASAQDIYGAGADLEQTVKRIMDTEPSRKIILSWMVCIAFLSEAYLNGKAITSDENESLQKILKDLNKWYLSNEYTASDPDFQEKATQTENDVKTVLATNKPQISESIVVFASNLKTISSAELSKLLTKYDIKTSTQTKEQAKQQKKNMIETKKQSKYNKVANDTNTDPMEVIIATATSTFYSLLYYAIYMIGGSLAANMAIGRSNMYRVLYFVYGSIPYFAPLVILYTIYRRISYGPVHLYGILPLSTSPATSPLGKIFKFPFYWEEDDYSRQEMLRFNNSLIVK